MRSFAKVAAVAAIPSVAFAITIADFTPRVYNLPSTCYTLYNVTSIPGCQASDFQGGHGCSNLCVIGMTSMVGPIQLACSGADIRTDSPLYAFVQGVGVHDLCPNVPAPSTTQQPQTTQAPTTTSTQQPTTMEQPTTTDTPVVIATTSSSSAVLATHSSSTTASSTASSTSSSTSVGFSAQSTSSSSSSSATGAATSSTSSATQAAAAASTTKPSYNSGGGSPFDTTSSNGAVNLSNGSGCAFALFLSALLAGYAL